MDTKIAAEWTAKLEIAAQGLNLDYTPDRVTFRARVEELMSAISAYFIGSLARAMGHRGPLAPGKTAAIYALTHAYIARVV